MDYVEFKLGVTIWSLEEPGYVPCPELKSICELIDANNFTESLAELCPTAKIVKRNSRSDANAYIAINCAGDRTDQMGVVGLFVRCNASVADMVEEQLRRVCVRSEVKTALLRGDLGLKI